MSMNTSIRFDLNDVTMQPWDYCMQIIKMILCGDTVKTISI